MLHKNKYDFILLRIHLFLAFDCKLYDFYLTHNEKEALSDILLKCSSLNVAFRLTHHDTMYTVCLIYLIIFRHFWGDGIGKRVKLIINRASKCPIWSPGGFGRWIWSSKWNITVQCASWWEITAWVIFVQLSWLLFSIMISEFCLPDLEFIFFSEFSSFLKK